MVKIWFTPSEVGGAVYAILKPTTPGILFELSDFSIPPFLLSMSILPDPDPVPIRNPTSATWVTSMRTWFEQAAHPATVRRARLTAMIVGTLLIAINHGGAIVAGELTRGRVLQMCLTVLVPYLVSTVSSVATRRELGK